MDRAQKVVRRERVNFNLAQKPRISLLKKSEFLGVVRLPGSENEKRGKAIIVREVLEI